jgi:hypothetical protein
MKPADLFLGLILAVAGCAQFGLQETALSTPIAPSEVDWARGSGANTVSGVIPAPDSRRTSSPKVPMHARA